MSMLVLDPSDQAAILAERRESGGDRYDEVWDGVYIMSPLANDEHQDLVGNLTFCFKLVIQYAGLGKVRPGVNVSDRVEDWERNYRVPDVAVFLKDTAATCHGAFWHGGPDFAVEVISRNDRTREKLEFYGQTGTRQLLVIDRYPWSVELYRRDEAGVLVLVGRSTVEQPNALASLVVPLTFALEPGEDRPQVRVNHVSGAPSWLA